MSTHSSSVCYLLNVAYPVFNVLKWLFTGDVIYQHNALKTKQAEIWNSDPHFHIYCIQE